MGYYSVVHQTAAGTDLPIINITASATVRINIYDVVLGSDATPADVAGEFVIDRTTDAGTGGTALTENGLDPIVDAATRAGVGGTFGTAPTDTANSNLMMIGLNQRATFRWVAAPERELYSPVGAQSGICLVSPVLTAAYNVVISEEFTE